GFLEFNIESTQVSISPEKDNIYITINMSEGERFIVSSVKLAGDLILTEDDFRNAMKVKAGDIFSRETVNESTKAISDKLSGMGYAFANVNVAPEVDKEKRQVAFTVFVDPGKRVYVRRINIGGNTKTRDEVVRQEIRQMEGAWYDDQRVKLSKQRIDKTDYFSEVTVETPPVPGTTDQIDINFGVTEKTTGNISVGAGYSQSEKVILSGSISQANIFGSGKYASVQIGTGKINRAIGFSYNNPYFTVDGVSQGFDVYHRKSDPTYLDYMYKTESTGGGIKFGIPISENQSINFGAAFDYTKVTIDRADSNTPRQYERFVDRFCGQNTDTCGNLSIPLTVGWVSDGRDSVINPTRGAYQRATFELSPGGDLRYYKLTYQYQRYFPVTRELVLMLNGEAGYGKGLGGQEMPFFKNFYAGGTGSVRGWDTASLGPYEIDSEDDDVRLGGTRRFVFNAELSVPVPGFGADKSFRFGPFFDAGQVYSDGKVDGSCSAGSRTVCGEGPVRMSVGLAATWLSPLGPLKFSFAHPLNKQNDDNIQRFQFQMGTMF
ncbi:MAG: outer membrane protein assembly factor BamA, partial [Candidatus Accumulibacter sp.]|nr:outer membrane protein assembly factor BamA [Accumulibacter sp.]